MAPVMEFLSNGIKGPILRIGLLVFVVAMLALGAKSRKSVLLALLAWPLANGMTEALKTAFPMERPSVDFVEALVRGGGLTSSGTASSHAANMAAVAWVLTAHLKGWGYPWIVIAILTGLSRIYMGVHYPSQVLLGWVCGAFCGIVVVKTWEAYLAQQGRNGEPQPGTNGDETDTD